MKQQQEEENNTVVELRTVQGGKTPPPTGGGYKGPGQDWLSPLEIGTIFLCGERSPEFNLGQFQLVHKEPREPEPITGKERTPACLLISNLNGPIKTFVDPDKFCQRYNLFAVMAVIRQIPEEEQEDDKDNRIEPSS